MQHFYYSIDGLGNLHADQMFRTTAEAKGLDQVKLD